MIIVVICNLIKGVCVGLIAWNTDPQPLVTVGDAITSFLDEPDATTRNKCNIAKTRFEGSNRWQYIPTEWRPMRRRWFRAASNRRCFVCNIL